MNVTLRKHHWTLAIVGLAIAGSAAAQQAPTIPAQPASATPGPGGNGSDRPRLPVVTMPRYQPLKYERPRYNQYSGFTRPSGFTYQGPRSFSRPFDNGYLSNQDVRGVPYYPLDRSDTPPWKLRPRIPQQHSPAPRFSDYQGTPQGFHDPFSTRYPISETTHTIVSNNGTIRTFTTIHPVNGYGRSYDRRHADMFSLFRYRGDRFRARAYLNNGTLFDPYRCFPYQPVQQVYLSGGLGYGTVFYGPMMTVEEHRAANSGIIPGSVPAPQPDPAPSPLDEAILALDAGHAEMAIPRFRELLMLDPDDAEIRRMLGLCLLIDRDLPQGLAELAGAYARDPGLAAAPIDIDRFMVRRASLTDATSRVIAFARRNNAPVGFFAAAVIQQARGEIAIARRMLELANEAGLDADLANPLRGALTPPK